MHSHAASRILSQLFPDRAASTRFGAMSEIEHQLKQWRPTIKAGVVWSNDRRNWRIENSQTLCDHPDTMVVDWIPLHPRGVLIGIAELTKDERCAAIYFPLSRNHKLGHAELEAVVERFAEGQRASAASMR